MCVYKLVVGLVVSCKDLGSSEEVRTREGSLVTEVEWTTVSMTIGLKIVVSDQNGKNFFIFIYVYTYVLCEKTA